MKKFFLFFCLIVFLAPTITYASWWNPFSWKMFSRFSEVKSEVVTNINISTTSPASESVLLCNNQKWNPCPENQKFVCPKDGSEAFCEEKSSDVQIPKLRKENISPVRISDIKQNNLPDESLCSELDNKIAVFIATYKLDIAPIGVLKQKVKDEYEVARQDLFQQLVDRQGVFYVDPNSAFNPEQNSNIYNSSRALYQSILDSYAVQASEKMEVLISREKTISQIAKDHMNKLQTQYPECPVSSLKI